MLKHKYYKWGTAFQYAKIIIKRKKSQKKIINIIEDEQGNPLNLSENSLRRTKKKKTRMPKEILFNHEEEERLSIKLKKKESFIDFDESSEESKENNKIS